MNPAGGLHAVRHKCGGNHFAELQQIEHIADATGFGRLGLDKDRLLVLVHSGSRGLGKKVLQAHQTAYGYAGLQAISQAAHAYMARHDHAVAWARANRALIAWRFLAALGGEGHVALDLPHNFAAKEDYIGQSCWVHRKGSNPGNRGAVVIPSSRGALSYRVEPTGNQTHNAASLAHGAGLKWNRSDCQTQLRDRFDEDKLMRTNLGSRVICEDRALHYEEAPQAYKKIEDVIQSLVEFNLVRVIATLRPLITYKLRRNHR